MGKGGQLGGYPWQAALVEKVPTILGYPLALKRFQRGQVMVRFREPLRELQFMVEGRAKVFSVMENGRAVLHTVFQGLEVIGDLEFLLGYPEATTDIVAVTDTVLLTLPLDTCRPQLLADPAMLCFLGRELARKLERSSRQSAQNMLYPLSARLAAYLLFSAQDGIFAENLTHVSELLAVSYRHLLRTFKSFGESGAIQREPPGYRIADIRRLEKEAGNLLWNE